MNGGHGQKIDHYLAQIRNAGQFTGIGSGNTQTINYNLNRRLKRMIASHNLYIKLPKECNDLTIVQCKSILHIQGFKCNICKKWLTYEDGEFDCIIPLSKGGALTFYNVQILCRHCHAKKHTKIIECDLHLVEKFEFKGYFTELDYKLLDMMV